MNSTIEQLRGIVQEYDAVQERCNQLNDWLLAAFRAQVYEACLAHPTTKHLYDENKDKSLSEIEPLWHAVSWAIHLDMIIPFYGTTGKDFGVCSSKGDVFLNVWEHILNVLTCESITKEQELPKTKKQFFL